MNIIQIGTNKGNDELTKTLNQSQPSILILIEPIAIHNDSILNCYKDIKNIHIENVAITTNKNIKSIDFYLHPADAPCYEIATDNPDHLIKHGMNPRDAIKINVKTTTINDIFKKYSLNHVDILFIDAEGADDKIIKDIDYNAINIDKIFFENLHLPDLSVYDFLLSKNYKITKNTGDKGWNSIAEKLP